MGKTLLLNPGFRFHPTDVELVKYYLRRKVLGRKFKVEAITEIDIYKYAPCDLPDKSCLKSRDLKWYFFCPIEKKYACGARINRATESGYWKTTGKDRPVTYNGEVVGMIKTLIFHQGRAPNGCRTDWVMHEYRLEDKNLNDVKDLYVLCMIFQKEGRGPRNGAQYGAPFREEEWTDDEEESRVEVGPSAPSSLIPGSSQIPRSSCFGSSSESCLSVIPSLQVLQPNSSTDVGLNNSVPPKCKNIGSSSESCISDMVAPSCNLPQPIPYNDFVEERLPIPDDNDILSLLYNTFDNGGPIIQDENDKNKVTNNIDQHDHRAPHLDETNVYGDLFDLGNLSGLGVDGIGVSNPYNITPDFDEMFSGEDGHFLELMDLSAPLVLPGVDETRYGQLCSGSDCNSANLGSSSYQVNSEVKMLPGGAFGLEDHQFNPCTAAQIHSHSTLPEPDTMYQCLNPNTIYGSHITFGIPSEVLKSSKNPYLCSPSSPSP